jgi:hypothetical protein
MIRDLSISFLSQCKASNQKTINYGGIGKVSILTQEHLFYAMTLDSD